MKIAFILGVLIVVVAIASVIGTNFDQFKSKFKKSYSSTENKRRKAIFEKNSDKIAKLNKKSSDNGDSVKFTAYRFADLDDDELKATYLGLPAAPSSNSVLRAVQAVTVTPDTATDTFDWQSQGLITPVKSQGGCGSCYIFGSMAVVESYFARKNKKLPTSFSEQQLLNCRVRANPCNGGWPEEVFNYIKKNGAVTTESNPYSGNLTNACNKKLPVITKIGSFATVPTPTKEVNVINVLKKNGPIVICLNVNKLFYYQSGVYRAKDCDSGPNHAVTLVGYGRDSASGLDYWRIRNSWGADWGENGYFRIERHFNTCDMFNKYSGYLPRYVAS